MAQAMHALLLGGKYKILQALHTGGDYGAYVCMDVVSKNNYAPYILNVYGKKEDIQLYLPEFYELREEQLPEYQGVFAGKESLIAVFRYYEGQSFACFFSQASKEDFLLRASYVRQLFEICLALEILPEKISQSVLKEENLVVLPGRSRLHLNYVIKPEDGLVFNPVIHQMLPYIEEIWADNRYMPKRAKAFLQELQNRKFESIREAFSEFKIMLPKAEAQYTNLLKEPYVKYLIRKIKRVVLKKCGRCRRRF